MLVDFYVRYTQNTHIVSIHVDVCACEHKNHALWCNHCFYVCYNFSFDARESLCRVVGVLKFYFMF